jgi:hypothetical protein
LGGRVKDLGLRKSEGAALAAVMSHFVAVIREM